MQMWLWSPGSGPPWLVHTGLSSSNLFCCPVQDDGLDSGMWSTCTCPVHTTRPGTAMAYAHPALRGQPQPAAAADTPVSPAVIRCAYSAYASPTMHARTRMHCQALWAAGRMHTDWHNSERMGPPSEDTGPQHSVHAVEVMRMLLGMHAFAKAAQPHAHAPYRAA